MLWCAGKVGTLRIWENFIWPGPSTVGTIPDSGKEAGDGTIVRCGVVGARGIAPQNKGGKRKDGLVRVIASVLAPA